MENQDGKTKSSGNDRRLFSAERQIKALELRRAGMQYEEIARRLGYSNAGGAYKAVSTALRKMKRDIADDIRKIEEDRLDAALSAIWPQVLAGKGWAIERMISIMERRAKLLGLDAPEQVRSEMIVRQYVGINVDET